MKKKKKNRLVRSETPTRQLRTALKKVNWRLVGITLLSFLAVYALYEIGVYREWKPIIHIYAWASLICAILFVFANGGIGKLRQVPDRKELPKEMPEEEKDRTIRREANLRLTARVALILLISLLLTLVFDTTYLYLEPLFI